MIQINRYLPVKGRLLEVAKDRQKVLIGLPIGQNTAVDFHSEVHMLY